jgi:hypothetical protein
MLPDYPCVHASAYAQGEFPACDDMQAVAEPHRQLLNLIGERVNNHPCYLYCYWICLIYNTTVNILYIYDVYIVTMICR